jgi:hypothetical protein
MARDVNFASKVVNGSVVFNQASQQNTSLTGSGTLNTDIFTLYSSDINGNGTKIKKITVSQIASCSGTEVRFFTGNGSNRRLKFTIYLPPKGLSSNEATPIFERFPDIDLIPGDSLFVSISSISANANHCHVTMEGGDY